jgi:hypothetical protein
MSSPKVFIEEQLALRTGLVTQLEQMENHLAEPRRSPSFGTHRNFEQATEQSIEWVKEKIADIDARIARLESVNA